MSKGTGLQPHAAQPITLGCFTLSRTGVKVKGKPTLGEFQGTLEFVTSTHQASGWWLCDLIAYADSRQDWDQHIDAIIDAELMSEKTVQQYRWLNKKVAPSRRLESVPFASHLEVASVEPEEQSAWLHKAKDNGWSARELRQEIRASKRVRVLEGQAKLEGQHRVIYADPPWLYGDSGATIDGSLGKAERHYPGMTIAQLCELPVAAHATPDAVLFMWVTVPLLYENPGPREVLEAWGFTYKTSRTWDKVLGMPGHYALDVTHEVLIIGTRGNGMPDVTVPHEKSCFIERRTDEHSAKPESVRKWIEKHWTVGSKLELFARQPHEGWTTFGNDARLWEKVGA
jgi:N6-adenosine-specific RNA methylase IME4